jgi:hypothetical protein
VRETWAVGTGYDHIKPSDLTPNFCKVGYAADDGVRGCRKRPGIFMPRWASRITLGISDVRIQRLNEISEDDAIAEGVDAVNMADIPRQASWSRKQDFSRLWDHINGAGAWDQNPWVVAISFSVHKINVDALLNEAAHV